MVFGEESFAALFADKVSPALVGVHVLLQVVGLEKVFVALRALDSAFAALGKSNSVKITCASSNRRLVT